MAQDNNQADMGKGSRRFDHGLLFVSGIACLCVTALAVLLITSLPQLLKSGMYHDSTRRYAQPLLVWFAPKTINELFEVCDEFGSPDRITSPFEYWNDVSNDICRHAEEDPAYRATLLDHLRDPNARDFYRITLLHRASEHGYLQLATALLAKGAYPSKRTTHGDMPIHYASENGHVEIIDLLLKHGADIESAIACEYVRTPLHLAVVNGKVEAAKYLVSKGADIHKQESPSENTLLHLAAQSKSLETLRFVLDLGFDVNARNAKFFSRTTPLYIAAWNGPKESVQLLLVLLQATGA